MASTTTQPVHISAHASENPLVLWHLLSLDAPTVAALWTWFIAHTNGVPLPWLSVQSMFLAVWVLYAADRLLDARALGPGWPASPAVAPAALEARHLFHHRHRTRFLTFACAASVLLAALLPRLNHVALRLFAAEGAVLAAWFLTLHATPFARHLPKELALGPFFAAAVFIPTVARVSLVTPRLLLTASLFAVLCSLNCLFIHRWEFSPASAAHASTHLAARYAPPLALALGASSALAAFLASPAARRVPVALALSAATLFLLDRLRTRLPRTPLRATADLALLTPLLVLIPR